MPAPGFARKSKDNSDSAKFVARFRPGIRIVRCNSVAEAFPARRFAMNERTVFLTALEKEDSAQRKAYLDEACAGDPALRDRVEVLLQSHEREGPFLEVPAPEQLAAADMTQ